MMTGKIGSRKAVGIGVGVLRRRRSAHKLENAEADVPWQARVRL